MIRAIFPSCCLITVTICDNLPFQPTLFSTCQVCPADHWGCTWSSGWRGWGRRWSWPAGWSPREFASCPSSQPWTRITIMIWPPHLTLNCIILQIILCVYNLQFQLEIPLCGDCVTPACQLLWVDPQETEEADHHDGDETVQHVVSAIVGQSIVTTIRQIGQEENCRETCWGGPQIIDYLPSAERIVAALGVTWSSMISFSYLKKVKTSPEHNGRDRERLVQGGDPDPQDSAHQRPHLGREQLRTLKIHLMMVICTSLHIWEWSDKQPWSKMP